MNEREPMRTIKTPESFFYLILQLVVDMKAKRNTSWSKSHVRGECE